MDGPRDCHAEKVSEKEKYCMTSLICRLWKEMIQMNSSVIQNRKKKTHWLRVQTYGCQGEWWRKGTVREFGMKMYILLYLKWTAIRELLYNTWNSAQCYVAACAGWGFGGEWMHVYVWLSSFAVHLKLSQHCYSAILQHRKVLQYIPANKIPWTVQSMGLQRVEHD